MGAALDVSGSGWALVKGDTGSFWRPALRNQTIMLETSRRLARLLALTPHAIGYFNDTYPYEDVMARLDRAIADLAEPEVAQEPELELVGA